MTARHVLEKESVEAMIASVLLQLEGGRIDQAVAELRAFQLNIQCSATNSRPSRSQSIGSSSDAEKSRETERNTVRVVTNEPWKAESKKRSAATVLLAETERLLAKSEIADNGNSLAKSCDVGQLVRKGKAAREKEKKDEKKEKKKKKRELKNSKKKPSSPADGFALSAPSQPKEAKTDARPPAPVRTVSTPLHRESTLAVLKKVTPLNSNKDTTTEPALSSPREVVVRSEKQQKQYLHVVRELFDTERGYIRDLNTIIDLFKNPLEQEGLVSASQSAILFSNIEMLRQVNSELLRQLEDITANEDQARLAATAEGNAEGMSKTELDTLKQITGIMTVTVIDSAGFQFDKRLPIDASVTFGQARQILVSKLAPLVAGGATTYENYRIHSAATNKRPAAHVRVLESVGFKKSEMKFLFKRDTTSSVSVGGALLNMAEYLKAYTEYCSNQLEAMGLAAQLEKKDKDMKQFLRKALKDKRCRQLDLNAFLIMPLQRVCKYPLLIRELIAATPDGHDEKLNLEKAAKLIGATVRTINESKKEREGLKVMGELAEQTITPKSFSIITPTRRYVSQGKILYLAHKAKEPSAAKYFFFNDIILICTVNDEEGKMHYLRHIEVKNAFVNAKGRSDTEFSIVVSRPGKNAESLVLVARSEREHKKMTDAVQQHIMRDAYNDWVTARQRAGAEVGSFEDWFKTYGQMFMQ